MLELREEYPLGGKQKLAALLHERGHQDIGIYGEQDNTPAERQGVYPGNQSTITFQPRKDPEDALTPSESQRRGYEVSQTGDLMQVDMLDIGSLPRVSLKHLTAHDVISRWMECS